MSERRSVRLKIPSERLALFQQSMDAVKKRKRVNWKPGEKEEMLALREKHPKMLLKDFQEKYYPDRGVKALSGIICQMRKDARKGEAKTEGDDYRHSNTPPLPELKRPRKSGPFEYSDSEDEDSSPDEIIEDINPSGHRTPNKNLQFIKLSHSVEAQSPSARHVEQREPMVRSQTDETPQISSETVALACRPQTTPPETITVAQDTDCLESSSSSTGMSPLVLEISLEQPAECHGTEMQVDVIQDEPQQQTQLQTPKQEAFPESFVRQEFAKDVTNIYARLQSLCRFEEQLFSTVNQTRAHNSALEKTNHILKRDYILKTEYEALKNEKDIEIAQLKADWQAERDSLAQQNALLGKRIELMKSALYGNIET